MPKFTKLGVFLLLTFLFSCEASAADISIQKVVIDPLRDGISFNTVIASPGWVTCPTVAMINRKEVSILNLSETNIVFLTGVSGSTASRWLFPREEITFKAASSLHIFVSADTVTPVQVTEIR